MPPLSHLTTAVRYHHWGTNGETHLLLFPTLINNGVAESDESHNCSKKCAGCGSLKTD